MRKVSKLKQYVDQFQVNSLEKQHLHGHPIQLYSGRKKLVHGSIMLIGEVAGCVDPLTAEGIRPAIKSGYLAAQTLAETIALKQTQHIKQYDGLFHEKIGRDFKYARILSYFINCYMNQST